MLICAIPTKDYPRVKEIIYERKEFVEDELAKFNEIKEAYEKQNKMLDLKSPNKDKTWTWSKKFPWEGEM